ncbi:MAG: histidine phosphatase family protein [Candidatus Nanopelagicales bacterium]
MSSNSNRSIRTVVHLMRHGEVYNPEGVLYGRLPGYKLSDLGKQMADKVAASMTSRDIIDVWASPLERAQETAAPAAEIHNVEIRTDDRLIEAANKLEGMKVSVGDGALKDPRNWRHLWNPITPSWGEPYSEIAERMTSVIHEARDVARGHEILLVSHQLPVWIARMAGEDRRLWHDPRNRQCSLASVTSFVFTDDELDAIAYSEPAADLVAKASKGAGA